MVRSSLKPYFYERELDCIMRAMIFKTVINNRFQYTTLSSLIFPIIMIMILTFENFYFLAHNWLTFILTLIQFILLFLIHVYVIGSVLYEFLPLTYKYSNPHFFYMMSYATFYWPVLVLIHYQVMFEIFIFTYFAFAICISIYLYFSICDDALDRFKDYVAFFFVASITYHLAYVYFALSVPKNLTPKLEDFFNGFFNKK